MEANCERLGLDGITGQFCQTLKEQIILVLNKHFQTIERIPPSSFCEARIIPILKSDRKFEKNKVLFHSGDIMKLFVILAQVQRSSPVEQRAPKQMHICVELWFMTEVACQMSEDRWYSLVMQLEKNGFYLEKDGIGFLSQTINKRINSRVFRRLKCQNQKIKTLRKLVFLDLQVGKNFLN